jgi:tRNA nucleotidyltransferase (CCA-adding enzyme)
VNFDTREILDPFHGQHDIKARILRCVGDTDTRMKEDALRILRALRFTITHDFSIHPDLESFLQKPEHSLLLDSVSIERIREELTKCFQANTFKTWNLLNRFISLRDYLLPRFVLILGVPAPPHPRVCKMAIFLKCNDHTYFI